MKSYLMSSISNFLMVIVLFVIEDRAKNQAWGDVIALVLTFMFLLTIFILQELKKKGI